jgi:hypothetical protein
MEKEDGLPKFLNLYEFLEKQYSKEKEQQH